MTGSGNHKVRRKHLLVPLQLEDGQLLQLPDALLGDAVRRTDVAQSHALPIRPVQAIAHPENLRIGTQLNQDEPPCNMDQARPAICLEIEQQISHACYRHSNRANLAVRQKTIQVLYRLGVQAAGDGALALKLAQG